MSNSNRSEQDMSALGWFFRKPTMDAENKELADARRRLAAYEAIPMSFDKGPWHVSKDGTAIESNDFTHDVIIKITGDFANMDDRLKYAQAMAQKLNFVPSTDHLESLILEDRKQTIKQVAMLLSKDKQ